jgi:hypothetical protein
MAMSWESNWECLIHQSGVPYQIMRGFNELTLDVDDCKCCNVFCGLFTCFSADFYDASLQCNQMSLITFLFHDENSRRTQMVPGSASICLTSHSAG